MRLAVVISLTTACMLIAVEAGNFYQDVDLTWGADRAKILDQGRLLTLSLDRSSGSGFQSKKEFLFSKIDIQLKLVPGNSAGTVTTFYLSSPGPAHDEIDFEFLGNVSGEPYTLHTNVFVDGEGNREQQFHLWFDPSKDFHTYSILWTPRRIIFTVDGVPVRDFKNLAKARVAFPTKRPMRLYSSLWNADDWATRGGLVKADWSKAPFVASFRNFSGEGCPPGPPRPAAQCGGTAAAWMNQALNAASRRRMSWVRRRYMIYDYCADRRRFPGGLPPECNRTAHHRGGAAR
ncbi:unnamed protein product [Spirodela intermedia]|uniref:Xyloglucan endotransglucosylase/hydrolase n=1 Tax=Spirodela intermedia TaxID=51605 RepID=A0A7I8KN64_SPIIN|nr:unnamed protein product [Spirodela intermedia]